MKISDPDGFTIQRSKWLEGKGKKTILCDEQGHKDCIGFLLAASGLSDQDLLNLEEPLDVSNKFDWTSKLINQQGRGYHQSKLCTQIITVNDSQLHRRDKEILLINLFNLIGIGLQFID